MNRKELGKEIEVLIRTIKIHYDSIGEEIRIPAIELELITSKIRKLYERSIVYNYLYSLEEDQLRNSGKLPKQISLPDSNLVLNKRAEFEKEEAAQQKETSTASTKKQGGIKSNIGINDRFLFTKELFGGNSNDYNEAIDKLATASPGELQGHLDQFQKKYNWNKESETVSNFMQLVAKK
jgi:hypothetical protein